MRTVNWKYGIYEWDWSPKPPTKEKFELWKKDFLSIPEVKNYEVWVAGGFLEEWYTRDIDIQLWGGPKDFKVIEKLLYEGTNIGITKYNMFVDMTYQISEDKEYWTLQKIPYHKMKPKKRAQLMIGDELYQNDKRTWKKGGIPLSEGLYLISYNSPKIKQKNRIYKNKPLRLR